jgi:MFS family permease
LAASLFTVIIVVFAGGWSDKKKLRKPLMLFAMVGDFLGCLTSLVSVIFWTQIPMEFARVLGTVVPAMFGGFNLMLMGCFAYITCITKEEDRTSRYKCAKL